MCIYTHSISPVPLENRDYYKSLISKSKVEVETEGNGSSKQTRVQITRTHGNSG